MDQDAWKSICLVGSQQASELKILVGEQKIELERQQRENANLTAQIEARNRAEADGAAASAKDISGLRLRVKELEAQQSRHQTEKAVSREGGAVDHDAAHLIQQIRDRVAHFFNHRDTHYVELLFKKHAAQVSNLMTADSMNAALCELGIQLTPNEVAVMFETADTDENGGLDLQEFKKVISFPSKVQQWTDNLPLSQLLAHCLSFKGGDDPLREVSCLSADELRASTEAYCVSLQTVLADALCELKKCYDAMDKVAASAANTKFQTPKMSAGSVEDFFHGLVGRVGEICFPCASGSRVSYPHSFLQAPCTRTFPRAWRTSIASRLAAATSSSPATTA